MTSMMQYSQVDRRSNLSLREFIHEYRAPAKPVVITGALDRWPAMSSWNFDLFQNRYGDSVVDIYRYRENDNFEVDRIEKMQLGPFIEQLLGNSWGSFPCYLRDNWSLFVDHPELVADYTLPEYFFDWFKYYPSFMRLIYPRIFMGPKGAVTPLHIDIWETHAWLAQLVGRKRWVLFPPNQRELLYPHLLRPDNSFQLRPDQPDFEKFPLYKNAQPLECTVGPGDLIFVPSGCAHQVTSLDPGISLTANYMGPGCFAHCITNSVQQKLIKRINLKDISIFLSKRLGFSA